MMFRIPKAALVFAGFWLGGAAIASLDKDIFLGLLFAIVGTMAFGK